MSRLMFQATAAATLLFVITILAMISMLLGDPDAPVNDWFNRYGGTLLLMEVLGIVAFGVAAMTIDRREIGGQSDPSGTGNSENSRSISDDAESESKLPADSGPSDNPD